MVGRLRVIFKHLASKDDIYRPYALQAHIFNFNILTSDLLLEESKRLPLSLILPPTIEEPAYASALGREAMGFQADAPRMRVNTEASLPPAMPENAHWSK